MSLCGVARVPVVVAMRVAFARRLDLDHVGAEIGQRDRRGGGGDERADVEHDQPAERQCHRSWHGAARAQARDLVGRQAGLGQDLVAVLAERRRGVRDLLLGEAQPDRIG